MKFEGEQVFIQIKQNIETFKVKVNKSLLPKKSANYPITIELGDDKDAKNFVKSILIVEVKFINRTAEMDIGDEKTDKELLLEESSAAYQSQL